MKWGDNVVYLVSYDLNEPCKDYQRLIDAIEHYDNPYRILKSQWLIQSDKSAKQICGELAAFVDESDELVVCEVNENFAVKSANPSRQGKAFCSGLLGNFPI